MAVALLLLLAAPARPWDLFLSASEGYTHYRAGDLNQVLVLMEKTTQEQGFNPYRVNQFDGHPQSALVVGWRHGPWRVGIETEFWVEQFHQAEVPFDLEEAGREYRITCDTLRNPAYVSDRLYGCVDARETFNFLPITAQVSYGLDLGRFLRAEAGYGLGVMAGSASIDLRSDYFGEGAVPDDRTRFDVWPGVNPVQKVFGDLEVTPWRFMGLTLRGGWRFSQLRGFELRNREGQSRIFQVVFPDAEDGARMYIQSHGNPDLPSSIYVGTEAKAKARAAADGSDFHLVRGDFTGWFLSLKLNLYWRDL
jgi:hypothetical protein